MLTQLGKHIYSYQGSLCKSPFVISIPMLMVALVMYYIGLLLFRQVQDCIPVVVVVFSVVVVVVGSGVVVVVVTSGVVVVVVGLSIVFGQNMSGLTQMSG